MTQKTTLPLSFTGPLAAGLPKFIAAAPVTSGLIRRFSAAVLDASLAGSPVASIPDSTGIGSVIAQGDATKRPKLRLSSGFQYLEFDGIDDVMTAGAAGPQGAYSMAVVARYRTSPAAPAGNNWPAFALARGGQGVYSMSTGGAMASYVSAALNGGGSPGTGWHVFQAVFNAASSAVRMDDADTTGSTGSLPNPTEMHLGMGTAGSTYIPMDVAEILVWNKALTLAERNKVATDLRATYGI